MSASPDLTKEQAVAARIDDRLRQLQRLGSGDEERGADRPAFSAADEQAHALVAEWMAEAGLEVERDPAGNVWGRREGTEPSEPAVWTGSHLDAVPGGGRFDGVLGVVAAIEAVRSLSEAAQARRTICVVAFRDEEGWRFNHGYYGSRWVTGSLEAAVAGMRDAEGVSVADARAALGLVAHPPFVDRLRTSAFLELHIEQGPRLAQADRPVGVVTSIVGMVEAAVSFHGQAGHAGTTPMEARRDPMAALADFATGLFARARSLPDSVATLGTVRVLPGAANVIPASVTVSVDARAATAGALSELLAAIHEGASAAASRSGCTAEVRLDDSASPAQMDAAIMDALDAAIRTCEIEPLRLPSGAGHDAGILAAAGVPTGMLFVRSGAGGVSHTPRESTSREDIAIATTVLERALRLLAER